MSRVNDPHRPETTLDGPTTRRVLRVPESLKERAQPTRQLMRRTRFRSALYCGLGAVIALAKRAIAFSPASTVTLVVSIVPSGPLNLTVCAPGST